MIDRERVEAAAASCGLRFATPWEMLDGAIRGEVIPAQFDDQTGEVTYAPECEEDERIQCLKRTLASEPEG